MNIDELVKRISKTDGLSKTLGMHFISTPEPDTKCMPRVLERYEMSVTANLSDS